MLRRARFALGTGSCFLLLAGPAGAVALDFAIDPERSRIGELALEGTLSVEVGALPLAPGENTAFDLIALDASAADGTAFQLREDVMSLGVLSEAGAFLIPQLFLLVDDGVAMPFAATVPDLAGTASFDADGDSLETLETAFEIDAGGEVGVLMVEVVAVPEPPASACALAALLATAGLAQRRRPSRRGAIPR